LEGYFLDKIQSPQLIWETALGELQIQVNKPNYDTWLKKTTGLRYENNEFSVGVPSTFIAEYMEQNQRSLVEKVLSGILQKEVQVNFQVQQTVGSPAGRANQTRTAVPAQQGALPLFNPRYTFESFVTGKCNQ
jgi:chromosomal replication initiator protein